MAEDDNKNIENNNKHNFIKERIGKKPIDIKKNVIKLIKIAISAVIFGMIAIITMICTRPIAQKMLSGSDTPSETYTIPRDDPNSESVYDPTDESDESTSDTQPVDDIVKSYMETYTYSAKDYEKMTGALSDIGYKADQYVVSVHSVKEDTDWFNNPVEKMGIYSGIVISKTDQEVLILTTIDAADKADHLKVTFEDDSEYDAVIKRTDSQSGLAVVAVEITDDNKEAFEDKDAIVLGNSYKLASGTPIIMVGSPYGMVHSTSYGYISYVAYNVSTTDGTTRLIYTDARSNIDKGTWMINIQGELVGFVYKDSDSDSNMTVMCGISDYKSLLEHMSNAQAFPYIGIEGTDIDRNAASDDMPDGIYVKDVVADSPAYISGIQPGDIVSKINKEQVKTMSSYMRMMEELHAEDIVDILIYRYSQGEYKEMQFKVTIGAR